ncbi:MAG: hypothetical protein PHG41_00915, partial [Actinomycetota bacterium]|nr:hypothetical protein [Actinomycetota bacterium]
MALKFLKNLPRRKKKLLYGAALVINDAVFLALAFFLSYYLRFYTTLFSFVESMPSYTININYAYYSTVFIVMNLIFFGLYKLYNWDQLYSGSGYYFRIFKAISINIIAIIVLGYLIQTFSFSRIWIGLLYIFSLTFIFSSRAVINILTCKLIKRLGLSSKSLIIGIGEDARRIEDSLKKCKTENFEIAGYVEKRQRVKKDKNYAESFNIVGYLEDLRDVVLKNNVQKVIISSREYRYDEILA